jgi:hypothetical protein
MAADNVCALEAADEAALVARQLEREILSLLGHSGAATRDLGPKIAAGSLNDKLSAHFRIEPFLRAPETAEVAKARLAGILFVRLAVPGAADNAKPLRDTKNASSGRSDNRVRVPEFGRHAAPCLG